MMLLLGFVPLLQVTFIDVIGRIYNRVPRCESRYKTQKDLTLCSVSSGVSFLISLTMVDDGLGFPPVPLLMPNHPDPITQAIKANCHGLIILMCAPTG